MDANNITFSFKHRMSTYLGYIILGLTFGTWSILIHDVKTRLDIDNAQLGILLLNIAIGAVISMFFTGHISAKFGCRKSIITSILLISLVLPILATSNSIFIMSISMFLYGIGLGVLDVTLNIQGALVEIGLKKHLMAGFHSMYSFGVFFAIIIMSILMTLDISYVNSVYIMIGIFLLILFGILTSLLPIGGETTKKIFTKPSRILFILGIICFIAFIGEGVILDWSVIFMTTVKNVSPEFAGYSFSLFFVTMGIFRVLGDKIADKYSTSQILLVSSVTTFIGIAIMLFIPISWTAFIGFTIAGAGLANLVPVAISSAGKYRGNLPLSIAVSSVVTVGYFGTLIGPSFMGLVSEYTSLTTAFLIIGLMILSIALISKGFRK